LARIEWAIVEVLHARAAVPISAQVLTSVPAQQLSNVCFEASEATRLLAFEYPVNDYLQAFYEDRQPTVPGPKASSVAVVRSNYTIWRCDLDSAQAALLSRLIQGEPLGAALDGIGASAAEIQAWFSEWTRHGLFAGLQFEGH
jgi:hypothetical protein